MIQHRRITVIPAFMQMRFLSPQAAAAAAADWWLSGGISAGNCHAAYAAKGAASLAASYSNLNNPGTNDAGVGVAPTWDGTNGWIFNGSTQYLTTTFVPQNDQTQTVIVQFSDYVTHTRCLWGATTAGPTYFLYLPRLSGGQAYYSNGDSLVVAGGVSEGNFCIAGNQGYLNGASFGGSIGTKPTAPNETIAIGAQNTITGAVSFADAYIQALAIYDTTLTAPQVAAVSAAMAAL